MFLTFINFHTLSILTILIYLQRFISRLPFFSLLQQILLNILIKFHFSWNYVVFSLNLGQIKYEPLRYTFVLPFLLLFSQTLHEFPKSSLPQGFNFPKFPKKRFVFLCTLSCDHFAHFFLNFQKLVPAQSIGYWWVALHIDHWRIPNWPCIG